LLSGQPRNVVSDPLDLAAALQIARRRGWVVILAVVLAVVAAWQVTNLLPRRYEASAAVFVGSTAPAADIMAGVQYTSLAQSLVTSYGELAETRRLARAAAKTAGLPVGDVAGRVTTETRPGVQLLRLRAWARSGEVAAQVANAAAAALISHVDSLGGGATHVGVRLVDAATVPGGPVSPRLPLNLLVGGLVGLLAGLALALGRERLDHRLRTAADAERELGLPVLGVIPPFRRRTRLEDPFMRQANPAVAEPFRSLAVMLTSAARRAGHSRVLVTSARDNEGKSTVAAQLALALAENDLRVTLVEADLRRPTLARQFHDSEPLGRERLHPLALPDSVASRLTILAADGPELDSGGALRDPWLGRLLQTVSQENDLVLLDAPPALSVSDASILAAHADSVLLVVRANTTSPEDARAVVASFSRLGTSVIGVVLVGGSRRPRGGYYAEAGSVQSIPQLPPLQLQATQKGVQQ